MATHSLFSVQKIPVSPQQAWDFFSSPANLAAITPDALHFRIISHYPVEELYAGQLIEYKVSPVMGIPLYWMTEITHADSPHYFADEQRRGPYGFWQHQHFFNPIEGGVEMRDMVHYRNPMGWLGEIANGLFVRKKLLSIFEYRFRKIEKLLGAWPGGQASAIVIK